MHMDALRQSHSGTAPTRPLAPLRWFFNYLNSGLADGASIELRYVNAITLIGTFNVIASIFIELSTDKQMIAGFMASMALCAVINVLWLRKTRDAGQAATLLLLITLTMLTVMLIDGMYQNTAPIWLTTFPAIAFFFKGKHQGMRWFSTQLGLMFGIMLLQAFDLLHTPYSLPALILIFTGVVTVGMIIYVYETLRAKAEASLKQAREELLHLAHNDMLTGLPNRTAFYNQLPLLLDQAKQQGQRLAVLFIDLDNFKPINDTYGHEAGDQLLQQAARRLQQQLRGSDFIARFGGDEFVAILPGIREQHEIGAIAEKLIAALSLPFGIDGHQCCIGVSIGIGLYPDCAANVDALVQLADHAMYTAKLGGKNGYAACPLLQTEDVTPYQGKYTCNRTCLDGASSDSPA